MLENGKISVRQFMVLVILFTVGTSVLLAPSLLVTEAKQDAWIAGILGVGVGLLSVWLYNALGNLFPNKTLVEYSEVILGKWIGKAIALLFFSFTFTLAALVLRNLGDFLTTKIMPETPIGSLHIIFLFLVIMGARLGLEVLARSAEILFPWFIILFLLLVFFLFPEIKFENFQPILEVGVKPLLRSAIPFIEFPFLELVIFLMIFPYVNRTKDAGKAFLTGTSVGGIMLIILTVLAILVIGVDLISLELYPTYELAKKINIGDFLQRIEAIVAVLWFISIYFKLTICFYTSVLALAQTFKLKDYRPLTLPLGMILIVYSLIVSPNIVYNITFTPKVMIPYGLIVGLFLPLLLLGVASFRKKRQSKT
ncbi:GerAB/ArcD/ProY family transporter [Pseudalkalibacillus salsuginis]|uniref:GerAB/ArcD/ProY family transporter n=1 Tax=Pseudalkalibacillus salsuginis TaxID=2910972 RepID=UPI001F1EE3C8|nr:endospore germination permease [Pseudalkalibacillus salsuginis]MCF6411601.1 endospore germination permease [Pseudalkalibacillus salsuginis]